MGSFAIAMTISYEDKSMLDRCLSMAINAYGKFLSDIIVFNIDNPYAEYLEQHYGAKIVEENSRTPIFVKHQRMIEFFLDQTEATHFIKLDPDTIILRWDGEFPELAGEFIKYKPEHQKDRWRCMPKEWKKENRDFERKQFLHGINGGFSLLSRSVCEKIRPLFFTKHCLWPIEYLRTGARKEIPGVECMIGEEHSIAWYLHQIGIATGYCETVDQQQIKYYTYKGVIEKIKKPKRLQVFHPIKTEKQFKQLLKKTGAEYTQSTKKTNSIALGLVLSYESKQLVERAILLALKTYSGYVSDIIFVSKGFEHIDYFVEKYGVHVVEDLEVDAAYFVSLQKLHLCYLEKTSASHLITMDADTVCLNWNKQFPDLAGERFAFPIRKQKALFALMPQQWQKTHPRFPFVGCIHAIQGGFVFIKRELVQQMSKYFYLEKLQWSRDVRPAEEQVFGYYLRLVRQSEELPTSLEGYSDVQNSENERYVISPKRPFPVKAIESQKIEVYHPVKTNEDLLKVLTLLEKGRELKEYLIERGVEL